MADQRVPYIDENQLLSALRAGMDSAFEQLVEMYHAAMLRLAAIYTPNARVAEDVVQDTWIAVLKGIDKFEGRSSLKTWIFSILVNRARTAGQRESRTIPADLSDDPEPGEPSIMAARFNDNGEWASPVQPWDTVPEDHLESDETRAIIDAAIAMLPPNQREVITLRDIDGLTSEEVCNILMITETNQRVLLHRARTRVRMALERYLTGE